MNIFFSHVKSMHDMSDQMYGMCLLMKATHSGAAGQGSDTYNNIMDTCICQDSVIAITLSLRAYGLS